MSAMTQAPTKAIMDREFWRVGELILRRDALGHILEYTHPLPANVQANAFAAGPFCQLGLAAAPSVAGVYVVEVRGEIVYIGECASLSRRFGPGGYGVISPRNCHDDGQSTNCKLNSRVLAASKQGEPAVVWFHATAERYEVEQAMIDEFHPSWNGRFGRTRGSSPKPAPGVRRRAAVRRDDAAMQGKDFRVALEEMLRVGTKANLRSIHVRAGDVHRAVGGYPGPNHRMPSCCAAMRAAMSPGDRVVRQPPKGNGANFVVEYCLPRR